MPFVIFLGTLLASAAGLVYMRRDALQMRRCLDTIADERGGDILGGLITYPVLRFSLDEHPARLGSTVGNAGADGGGSSGATFIQVDVARPDITAWTWTPTNGAELDPVVKLRVDPLTPHRNLHITVDEHHTRVGFDEVSTELADFRALVYTALALLPDA